MLLIKPIFRKKKWSFGPRIRTTIGFLCASVAFLCAGLIEMVRKAQFFIYGYKITILWQIPQYVFIGMSEVLAAITLLEILYHYAPKGMKSIVIALNFIIVAIGSFIGAVILISIGKYWLPLDFNYGRFEYMCFCLSGAQLLTTFIFLFVTRRYEIYDSGYKRITHHEDEEDNIKSGIQFI